MIVEKHSRLPRKFTPKAKGEEQARLTVQGKAVPQEARDAVLEDAKGMILAGNTIAQIAEKHGISERTLQYWLSSLMMSMKSCEGFGSTIYLLKPVNFLKRRMKPATRHCASHVRANCGSVPLGMLRGEIGLDMARITVQSTYRSPLC